MSEYIGELERKTTQIVYSDGESFERYTATVKLGSEKYDLLFEQTSEGLEAGYEEKNTGLEFRDPRYFDPETVRVQEEDDLVEIIIEKELESEDNKVKAIA